MMKLYGQPLGVPDCSIVGERLQSVCLLQRGDMDANSNVSVSLLRCMCGVVDVYCDMMTVADALGSIF